MFNLRTLERLPSNFGVRMQPRRGVGAEQIGENDEGVVANKALVKNW
jgi:hypothetical protein